MRRPLYFFFIFALTLLGSGCGLVGYRNIYPARDLTRETKIRHKTVAIHEMASTPSTQFRRGDTYRLWAFGRAIASFDGTTGEVTETRLPVNQVRTLAVVGDSIWLAREWGFGGGEILRLNAQTMSQEAIIPLYARIVAGEGTIWAYGLTTGILYKIDPIQNKVVATITVVEHTSWNRAHREVPMAVGAGSVFCYAPLKGIIYRIDAAQNKITARLSVPPAPFADGALLVRGNRLWVIPTGVGTIRMFDLASNQESARADIPNIADLAFAGGDLFATNTAVIYKLDPETLAVQDAVFVWRQGGIIATAGDFLWFGGTWIGQLRISDFD
ncbi:MAG: YncE family protein [Limisphaerales bacterium]